MMQDFCNRVLNIAEIAGADYADVRIVERRNQTIRAVNGRVSQLSDTVRIGFGVRVLINSAWGFACSSDVSFAEAERVTRLSVDIAKASGLVVNVPVVWPAMPGINAAYRTPVEVDPFSIPAEQKIEILLEADAAMRKVNGIRDTKTGTEAFQEKKVFASTEGRYIEQEITQTGGGLQCGAAGEGEFQQRSYPNRFGRERACAGWEYVAGLDLPGNGERIANEALQLLAAPQCPKGVTTVILDGAQMALVIHETCGHAVELDRILGQEIPLAGSSFLSEGSVGKFRFGSEYVNIMANATVPGGLGTYGYDDEGIPATKIPLIRNGIFVGYLSNREDAARLGSRPGGVSRADGWSAVPLARMSNINLEPGDWDLEALIADTDDGIYMQLCRSLSIDNKRVNFQFGSEIAWEIKGGKLGRVLKNPTFTGASPQFWASCDAICSQKYWAMWGTDCGKGQPSQNVTVGHGTAPARFRNVQTGVF